MTPELLNTHPNYQRIYNKKERHEVRKKVEQQRNDIRDFEKRCPSWEQYEAAIVKPTTWKQGKLFDC